MAVSMPVYQSDPGSAPDSEFVPGALNRLVVGNRGRLLDARRTPVLVTAVSAERGVFEVEILAFEDTGSRWELGLEKVADFQFARDSAMASRGDERELQEARRRFDLPLVIEVDAAAAARTARAIAAQRQLVRKALTAVVGSVDLAAHVASREGSPEVAAIVRDLLTERDLAELDDRFAATFVSNPDSGELVKGHAIVLAELGLCQYQGKAPRDPQLFEQWSKDRRAEHIVLRLALTPELYARVTGQTVTLFRAAAVEGTRARPPRRSFVSATFSREVAEDHFAGGERTRTAVMWRQRTPAARLFMTFLETPALNRQFKEAEAILLADPDNAMF